MIKYEMLGRKPAKYKVEDSKGNTGAVYNQPEETVNKRWRLVVADVEKDIMYLTEFKSRRAAFHFFEHGTKFELTPVYATRGKAQKRIR